MRTFLFLKITDVLFLQKYLLPCHKADVTGIIIPGVGMDLNQLIQTLTPVSLGTNDRKLTHVRGYVMSATMGPSKACWLTRGVRLQFEPVTLTSLTSGI